MSLAVKQDKFATLLLAVFESEQIEYEGKKAENKVQYRMRRG